MLSDMAHIHVIRLSVQLARPGVTSVLSLLAPSRAPSVNQATLWTRTRRARVRPLRLIFYQLFANTLDVSTGMSLYFSSYIIVIVIYRMRSFYFEII